MILHPAARAFHATFPDEMSHKVCVHVDLWTGKQKEGKSLAAEGKGARDLEKVHHYDDDDGDEMSRPPPRKEVLLCRSEQLPI